MGRVIPLVDRLVNALTGSGTARDPRTAGSYALLPPLTDIEIAAAYRGSGLMRKICTIPALDMVREWRVWQAEKDQVTALEAEEKRLGIQRKAYLVERLRALGGGALVLGLPGNPSEEAPAVGKGGLAYINVVSRWQLSFDALQSDPTQPGFGEPVMWRMQTATAQVSIHPSRVIPFRADPTPPIGMTPSLADEYWGESVVAQVLDAVKDSDTARASFSALLHKARLLRIGIPNLMDIVSTAEGERLVMSRLAILTQAESIHNATIFDAGNGGTNPGEQITDATYSFAGAKDVLNAYAEFVCAVSDIPATRLLGRAPEGMNSSGDSQQADWAKKIKARQALDLAPCLDRLDAYLIPSALGARPEEIWWQFGELTDEDEGKEATRFKTIVEALVAVQNMAAMPDRAFAQAAQNTLVEGGWMPGLDKALSEIPEDERFGIEPDMTEGGDPDLAGPGGAIGSVPPVRASDEGEAGGY